MKYKSIEFYLEGLSHEIGLNYIIMFIPLTVTSPRLMEMMTANLEFHSKTIIIVNDK